MGLPRECSRGGFLTKRFTEGEGEEAPQAMILTELLFLGCEDDEGSAPGGRSGISGLTRWRWGGTRRATAYVSEVSGCF